MDSLTLALVAACVAGLVRGFTGFGSSLVIVPWLSAVYGPRTAVPVALLVELLLAVPFVPPATRHVDWPRIRLLCVAALVTVPLGAVLLATVDPDAIRWAISLVVVAAVGVLGLGWRYSGVPRPSLTLATGATSGILNGAVGLAGPPVVFYYLAGADTARAMRASFIVFFAWVDSIAVLSFALTGTISQEALVLALEMAVPYLLCAWAGARLFRVSDEARYRRIAMAVLLGVAVSTVPV
jgi:uncharacterized membrane protein YfcA